MSDWPPLSIYEMRRRAPLHYWARANNARFVAYWLSHSASVDGFDAAAIVSGYRGTPDVALYEGFRREAALALELIVKAVIARKIEQRKAPEHVVRVRPVHDVPRLWIEAALPALSTDDQLRLLAVKILLSWSGRYAAPKNDQMIDRERNEEEALSGSVASSANRLRIRKMLPFGWDDFDRIYQIAAAEFHTTYAR